MEIRRFAREAPRGFVARRGIGSGISAGGGSIISHNRHYLRFGACLHGAARCRRGPSLLHFGFRRWFWFGYFLLGFRERRRRNLFFPGLIDWFGGFPWFVRFGRLDRLIIKHGRSRDERYLNCSITPDYPVFRWREGKIAKPAKQYTGMNANRQECADGIPAAGSLNRGIGPEPWVAPLPRRDTAGLAKVFIDSLFR